jgi:hypothetical protein
VVCCSLEIVRAALEIQGRIVHGVRWFTIHESAEGIKVSRKVRGKVSRKVRGKVSRKVREKAGMLFVLSLYKERPCEIARRDEGVSRQGFSGRGCKEANKLLKRVVCGKEWSHFWFVCDGCGKQIEGSLPTGSKLGCRHVWCGTCGAEVSWNFQVGTKVA